MKTNIVFEAGDVAFVLKTSKGFEVCVNKLTHSAVDSVYTDLSIAMARARYLERRATAKLAG